MLKANVGYSINLDSYTMGVESITKSTEGLEDVKINFVFQSIKNDFKEINKGIRSVNKAPIIGCTSSGGLIVPDGVIVGTDGYTGILSLDDPTMTIGIACHEAGKNAREIGRKVAIEAVKDAKSTRAPSYFYMVATPKEEEEYLMGIQDVIGRVPMFGGTTADDDISGKWEIICNDKILKDGVAVAFFYTDNEIVTSFTGEYKETKNIGLITEVKNNRTLVTIDEISALKKYAHWIRKTPNDLQGNNLLLESVTKPLGVKDPLGNLTVIRHPMFGNDMGTKTTTDDTITLGNKIVAGTAIIQLEATKQDLIDAPSKTVKDVKRKIYTEPAAYIIFHSAGRKMVIADKLDIVHKQLLRETKKTPFIVAFTFGEFGYEEHSANICGGLMISTTAFGKN